MTGKTLFETMKAQQDVYRDGMQAFADEIDIDECPHDPQSTFGILWAQGWESAAGLAEREYERQKEDQRLDDPRHGQAKDINRGRG